MESAERPVARRVFRAHPVHAVDGSRHHLQEQRPSAARCAECGGVSGLRSAGCRACRVDDPELGEQLRGRVKQEQMHISEAPTEVLRLLPSYPLTARRDTVTTVSAA